MNHFAICMTSPPPPHHTLQCQVNVRVHTAIPPTPCLCPYARCSCTCACPAPHRPPGRFKRSLFWRQIVPHARSPPVSCAVRSSGSYCSSSKWPPQPSISDDPHCTAITSQPMTMVTSPSPCAGPLWSPLALSPKSFVLCPSFLWQIQLQHTLNTMHPINPARSLP